MEAIGEIIASAKFLLRVRNIHPQTVLLLTDEQVNISHCALQYQATVSKPPNAVGKKAMGAGEYLRDFCSGASMKLVYASLAATIVGSAFVFASPAFGQEGQAEALTVSGGATLVSDYRFRGISQTDKRFALQGTIAVAHQSGFYATIWGSSIDDYVANGSDQEIDLIAGYATTFGDTTLDVGATYYYYPGSDGADTDFIEPYVAVSRSFGAVSGKILAAYAPKQNALGIGAGREDNFYLAGDLSMPVPGTPISLTGHLGHSWGPSYLTIGNEYTDWSIGASAEHAGMTFGLAYVDTDKSLVSPSGRNIGKAGIVGSVGVSF